MGSESKTRKKQLHTSVTKTPNASQQSTMFNNGILSVGNTDRSKAGLQPKPISKTNINMFQTMNEPQPTRIVHQRNSSKSSCYIAASDLTTERGKPNLFGQPNRSLNTRSGSRPQNHQGTKPNLI